MISSILFNVVEILVGVLQGICLNRMNFFGATFNFGVDKKDK